MDNGRIRSRRKGRDELTVPPKGTMPYAAATLHPVDRSCHCRFHIGAAFAADQEWQPLVHGSSLDGWVQPGGKAKYRAEDGEVIGTSVPIPAIRSSAPRRDYGDFELELEFKVDPTLNSGIQIRSECFDKPTEVKTEEKTIKIPAGRVHGYQVEIDPSDRSLDRGHLRRRAPRSG